MLKQYYAAVNSLSISLPHLSLNSIEAGYSQLLVFSFCLYIRADNLSVSKYLILRYFYVVPQWPGRPAFVTSQLLSLQAHWFFSDVTLKQLLWTKHDFFYCGNGRNWYWRLCTLRTCGAIKAVPDSSVDFIFIITREQKYFWSCVIRILLDGLIWVGREKSHYPR